MKVGAKLVGKLFASLLCFATVWNSKASDKPNVVFILSDNQSYYEMSCHGHADIKTPHIDKLADQSVEFTNFHAPPFCSPSRAVILTGRHAMRSGVFTTISGRSILHKDEKTLPQFLKPNGYHSAIFGKWHLGFSYPYRPKDRGFDEVFVHGGGGVGQMEDYFGNSLFNTTFIHNGKVSPSKGYCTDVLFDRAMDYVEAKHKEKKPFFCFVSTPVTHSPHHGPKELVAQLKAEGIQGNLQLYAQVQNLDANIGRMMKKIKELGLAENTILVYASDQGMNDRGAPHGDNRKGLGYDPAHHVPFMLRLPGAAPKVVKRLAGMIDFFPTILDLCGIKRPDNIDGISLKPLLLGKKGYPKDRTLIIQCPRSRQATKWRNSAVKTDRWRLVNGTKLYDVTVDPRQNTDIAGKHRDIVDKLRQAYETYWADLPDQATTLSRHLLGHPKCQDEVILNGMDWYRGASPWNNGAYKRPSSGAWAITVVEKGRYRFECRFFPRAADKPIGASKAGITIGDHTAKTDLSEENKKATFDLSLEPGDYDLDASFANGKKRFGALWIYVKKL
ncbi:MAG: sulfatase-like hydrolase/transferase [Opitutae bacterium]